ncbi:hypothetical protein ABEB36_003428 [Hypothenemus hampei]|uniref:Peptidase S1 domain-containing protein n=1 Tax=Hypothenemus hampei TaxID=57062 RepID=A0ABD1F943_HYPHA
MKIYFCFLIITAPTFLKITSAFTLKETSSSIFPFHAVIDGSNVCSGLLINEEYVLCPASCVNGSKWDIKISLGNQEDPFFLSNPVQNFTDTYNAKDIIVHEKFLKLSNSVYLNNIALLRLTTITTFKENIQPGLLFSKLENHLIGEDLVNVTGWSTTTVLNLSVAETTLLNPDTCAYLYGDDFFQYQETCLEWKTHDYHLNLSGNIVSVQGRILGFLIRAPCTEHDLDCKNHYKVIKISSFLDWISRKSNIPIETLTSCDFLENIEPRPSIEEWEN